ncbi:MAG: signal peptide peptidase SppA [Deltaproteobacteria bacterium]|nr:signal peptide peptidase SppA [Deltaproteobacteria bacterium]
MRKRPFVMALGVFGAIFLFFVALGALITLSNGGFSSFLGEKVGVIEVNGVIVSSKKTLSQLDGFQNNASIKAIVLRIDSPGGSVGPSQEIFEELKKAAKVKPLVVSMGSVAASGGYYIAVPAQRIFSNPGTLTGSIGVIMEFLNVEELSRKVGFTSKVLKSGENKDIGSPLHPMRPGQEKILQELIQDVHLQFMEAVAENRKMELDAVRTLADGRVFSGRQALEAGLVDELGNLRDAVEYAAKLGGISGEPRVVYPPEDEKSLLDYFLDKSQARLEELLPHQRSGLNYLWNEG